MQSKKLVITKPSNPTENIQVKPDFYDGDSLGVILIATSLVITSIAELVKEIVPLIKKNNK